MSTYICNIENPFSLKSGKLDDRYHIRRRFIRPTNKISRGYGNLETITLTAAWHENAIEFFYVVYCISLETLINFQKNFLSV